MPIAGKVMPRPMGDYDPATIYGVLDIVNHDERPWLCRKDNVQGVEPTVLNTDTWQMLFDVDVTNADTLDGFDSSYFGTKEKQDALEGECAYLRSECAEIKGVKNATFTVAGWTEEAPYTQIVNVEGVTENDAPVPFFVDDSEDYESQKLKNKSYNCISYFDSGEGTITATCKYKKPEADFTVGFKGV